jgi:type III pantothenate kinase
VVADSCRSIAEREPDLTVQGLRLAFERHLASERQHAGDRHPPGRRAASP